MRSLALPLLLLGVAFAPTLVWIFDGWFLATGYYSHGPVLVLVCGWALFAARRRFRAVGSRPSRVGLVLLSACLLAHVAGQALMVDALSGLAFVPALLSLVLAVEGPARLRAVAPALGCLLFAVPLPIFVTGRIAYEMKHLATAAAVWLGNAAGLGLEQSGASILVPGQVHPLLVGDACSGLRSLVALVSLGYVYALFLTPRRIGGRIVFVLLSVPIALAANFVRIAVLAAIAGWKGVAFASGPAHDWSGYLLYAGAIILLLAADRVLPGRVRPAGKPPAGSGPAAGAVVAGFPTAACVAVAGLGLPALVLALWHPGGDEGRFAARVARATERFEIVRDHPFPERWYALIGTRDVCWRRYRLKGTRHVADLTAIFQGKRWKALHPPEVCLVSAGFEITGRERRSLVVAGEDVELTVLRVERGDVRFLVGYGFGGEDFVTPSFAGFFLRNVPRALFRRDTRGFLLRVDVPWPQHTAKEEAEGIMSAFLADFLPRIRGLLGR